MVVMVAVDHDHYHCRCHHYHHHHHQNNNSNNNKITMHALKATNTIAVMTMVIFMTAMHTGMQFHEGHGEQIEFEVACIRIFALIIGIWCLYVGGIVRVDSLLGGKRDQDEFSTFSFQVHLTDIKFISMNTKTGRVAVGRW